jgi:hypothetical protein
MAFSDEEREQIGKIVEAALEADWGKRRARSMARADEEKAALVSKVYLITMSHHQIAFPDMAGRSVLNQCFYARIKMNPGDPHFFGGPIEVLAFGDGKILETPITVVLTGGTVSGLVDVGEGFLEKAAKVGG